MVKDNYTADIQVPKLSCLSPEIEELNKQYAKAGKALYEKFKTEIEDIEAKNMEVNSGYIIQTDTDDILSFGVCRSYGSFIFHGDEVYDN